MEDIAPKLLQSALKRLKKGLSVNPKIKALNTKISEGSTDIMDAMRYADEVGTEVSKALSAELKTDKLPDGKLYYNIAKSVVIPVLQEGYKNTANASAAVQKNLNTSIGMKVSPIIPKFDKDRAYHLIDRLSEDQTDEGIEADNNDWLLGADVMRNFQRSEVTDSIEENAEFDAEAGIPAYIERVGDGCCDWCASLQGKYVYGEQPDDFFQVHKDCTCEFHYSPSRMKFRYIRGTNGRLTKENL